MLVAMLGGTTRADILQGNLGGFKGAIFENLMADTLIKKGQSLYYFQKDSGLELDFLIRYKGECVPVEVKAKSAQAKSFSTIRNLNFNLFCNDNVCFRIFAWSATLSTSLS